MNNISKIFIHTIIFSSLIIFGTISHEMGHIIIAKYLGYNTKLHFNKASHYNQLQNKLLSIYNKREKEIKKKKEFPEKKEYIKGIDKINKDNFLITTGGVLLTIVIGSLGFFLLIRHKRKNRKKLSIVVWLYIYLSLFWIREVIILFYYVITILYSNLDTNYDEIRISSYLKFHPSIIIFIFGITGLYITHYIFLIFDKKERFRFIISGILGSIVGLIFWFYLIGPILLP